MNSLVLKNNTYTPTQLSSELGYKDAKEVNFLLKKRGLQTAYRDNRKKLCWCLTEFASKRNIGFYHNTGRLHKNGLPVLQIKWNESVKKYLQKGE